MMLVFEKDDGILIAFPSAGGAESWCELIDVQNGEDEFCDGEGQRYGYAVTKPMGLFLSGGFTLVPEGAPDGQNVMRLIDKARSFEGNRCGIGSIDELKAQVLKRKGGA